MEASLNEWKQDPSLAVSEEWLNDWIAELGDKHEMYHYLEGQTPQSLLDDKEEVLRDLPEKSKWLKSLSMYRVVNDLQDLRLGNHIRWIRTKPDGTVILTNGGILVQTKFLQRGTYVVCKNGRQMMQYALDECPTFQKLSAEEWLILMANESANQTG